MIEETKRKINFIPYIVKKGRDKDTSEAPTMTLVKGQLRFPKYLATELGLNGKFVKLFYEPTKRIIGFQVKEGINQQVMKDWKVVRIHEKLGFWSVSVKKLIADEFDEKWLTKGWYRIPVKKYVETDEIMRRGETFYYIHLSEDEARDKKPKKGEEK